MAQPPFPKRLHGCGKARLRRGESLCRVVEQGEGLHELPFEADAPDRSLQCGSPQVRARRRRRGFRRGASAEGFQKSDAQIGGASRSSRIVAASRHTHLQRSLRTDFPGRVEESAIHRQVFFPVAQLRQTDDLLERRRHLRRGDGEGRFRRHVGQLPLRSRGEAERVHGLRAAQRRRGEFLPEQVESRDEFKPVSLQQKPFAPALGERRQDRFLLGEGRPEKCLAPRLDPEHRIGLAKSREVLREKGLRVGARLEGLQFPAERVDLLPIPRAEQGKRHASAYRALAVRCGHIGDVVQRFVRDAEGGSREELWSHTGFLFPEKLLIPLQFRQGCEDLRSPECQRFEGGEAGKKCRGAGGGQGADGSGEEQKRREQQQKRRYGSATPCAAREARRVLSHSGHVHENPFLCGGGGWSLSGLMLREKRRSHKRFRRFFRSGIPCGRTRCVRSAGGTPRRRRPGNGARISAGGVPSGPFQMCSERACSWRFSSCAVPGRMGCVTGPSRKTDPRGAT